MTATKPRWRLCQKRPSVGFDHYHPWGDWESVVRTWWREGQPSCAVHFYVQASVRGKVHDYPVDPDLMQSESLRMGLTTVVMREMLVASSLAKRAPERPAMGPTR